MTAAAMTTRPPANLGRTERERQSLLAMLADSPHPLSTMQLEAAHGMYSTRIYNQLRILEGEGRIIRQPGLRVGAGNAIYWWPAARPKGLCAIADCGSAGVAFAPPRLDVDWIYIIDTQRGGLKRLFWREVVEVPGTGGWVCADQEHQRSLLTASSAAGDG